jgi:type III restriction enzyme
MGADVRFYPDFLCQLPGGAEKPGATLAVQYKGADRWAAAEDVRLIGGLWANLSEGRCRFVMVKDKRWAWIEDMPRHPTVLGTEHGSRSR